ncbi:MAG: PPE family protein [Nocardia sp.]|nr:PPE family protein [Nocardia sp.]
MTAGITGVFWLPRLAEGNSAMLNSGAHAVPIFAAATAWDGLTAAWVDATATVTRVMAELGVGMVGLNGVALLARLTGFNVWAEQQTVQAGIMAAKANGNAIAYTVASLAMPSPPEIAAVDAARVAAHAHGGDLDGSAEAAEAAKTALDIQAALVMETYEAATSLMVATPSEFMMPPPIANGAGSADSSQNIETAFQDGNGNSATLAAGVAQAVASNPGVANVATSAAQVAGSVASTGVSTAGNVAGGAVAAATSSHSMAGMGAMSGAAPMMGGIGAVGAVGGGAAATRAVSLGGASVNIGGGAGSLKLPEGWGAGLPESGGGQAAAEATAAQEMTTPAPAGRPGTPGTGNPLMGRHANQDDEHEHHGNEYLRGDHFDEGGLIAPGVIGADPNAGDN